MTQELFARMARPAQRPVTREPRKYYPRTSDTCTAQRHKPVIDSWRRGCRCPETVAAREAWLAENPPAPRKTWPTTRLVPEVPTCTAYRHNGTESSWREGCRCPTTTAAHDKHNAERARERAEQRAAIKATEGSDCPAVIHHTLKAWSVGCRHPESVRKHEDKLAREKVRSEARRARERERREAAQATVQANPWRTPDMAVNRNNLWFLVRGFVDRPTTGERLAAVVILSQIPVANGLRRPRHLTNGEIAERIGVWDNRVIEYKNLRVQLREERHLRRLADVRQKAARVAASLVS